MTAARAGASTDRVVTAPGERRDAVLRVIRGARRQLTMSVFRCDDEAILTELGRAVDRGVKVDVLVTGRAKGKKRLRRMLEALDTTGAVIHPYMDPVVKYHAKYLVADEGPAIVASLNFTRKCFSSTLDALVITNDPAVINGLLRLHAADREGRSLPDRLPARLVVGPERARQQFTGLIARARFSIRLIDPKLSDPVLTRLLDARREEGLTVDVHGDKKLNGLKSHGKLLLIDDRVAVVGSLALAALSLDFRREVALIVSARPAVAALARLFKSVSAARPARKAAGVAGARA